MSTTQKAFKAGFEFFIMLAYGKTQNDVPESDSPTKEMKINQTKKSRQPLISKISHHRLHHNNLDNNWYSMHTFERVD